MLASRWIVLGVVAVLVVGRFSLAASAWLALGLFFAGLPVVLVGALRERDQ